MEFNCIQSCPSSLWIYKYDVFLSFRGTDTRNNFIDHLYAYLRRKGIFTFKDDNMLEKGESISPQLLQAIKDSRVAIVIFSKDYAGSTWCLDEMAAIAECKKELKQTVFPVFYDVDPSDVRKQSGVYKSAFVSLTEKFKEDPGKVNRWKGAMTDLASSAGWDVRNRPEFEEIGKIVHEVIKKLDHKFSRLDDDLIGIQPRVAKLENLLRLSSHNDDFRVLGIWGMGGIGKTTHATRLYDKISYQFDAHCFIENVSQIYNEGRAVAIQKQIFCQTLDEKNLETYSPSGIIINRLHRIKVLIVLDNVDHIQQLQELAIDPKLLSPGSRIIITTRDEHILKVYGAKTVYSVPLLSDNDAWELFCRKAFKNDYPSSKFAHLIPEVLKYAQNLPLAIRVMGSFLHERDVTQWRATLDGLKNNPDKDIMNVLQISFEGLEQREREIFLHIACFFKGERKDYVTRILDCCGLNPDIGIPLIMEKSLIAIRNQEIHMHEMLQELGKKIVRDKFSRRPEKWSRLWHYKDFHQVITIETGAENVEAIVLDQKDDASNFGQLRAEELSKFKSLALLILHHKNFIGSPIFLSNRLCYLLWHGYPFLSLPSNFQPVTLVELNMPHSNIIRLWEGIKHLPGLKRVDLSNSEDLMETPNFEGTASLERLDLTGCTSLSQVHPSIGLLTKLAFLSFRNCSSLVSLNLGSESKLNSLKVLHLSGCKRLKNTPDCTGLSNLEYLDLEQCTSLSSVDESIGALAKLKSLSLRHCTNLVSIPMSINNMTSLITLDLRGCLKFKDFPLGRKAEFSSCLESLIFLDLGFCNLLEVPYDIYRLRCLERLNLEGNNFRSLPPSICRLPTLAYLNLSHCHQLGSFCDLPMYSASYGGRYFKTVSGSRNHRSGFYIFDCPKLDRSRQSRNALFTEAQHSALLWLIRLVKQPCNFRCGFDIVVPGSTIPRWFDYFMGASIIRIAHSDVDDNWIGFAFCVGFRANYHPAISGSSHDWPLPHPFYLSFESEHTEERFDMPLSLDGAMTDSSKYLWLIYISRPHCHFVNTGARITFKARPDLKVWGWGLRCLFKQDIEVMKRELKTGSREIQERRNMELLNEVEHDDHLPFQYVHEGNKFSPESKSPELKIQLPYNWLVTEHEENDKREAERKENNISNMGLVKDEENDKERSGEERKQYL